jgi:hypothetical protein
LTDLDQLLAESSAAESFKVSVRRFCAGGGSSDRIRIDGFAPSIKIKRVLAHMLSAEPHLAVEHVTVRGRSGCSDFVGTLKVHTSSGTHVYEFVWDCRWRAEQEGWVDYFGFPDQIRAAREYDWRCFERWEVADMSSATL